MIFELRFDNSFFFKTLTLTNSHKSQVLSQSRSLTSAIQDPNYCRHSRMRLQCWEEHVTATFSTSWVSFVNRNWQLLLNGVKAQVCTDIFTLSNRMLTLRWKLFWRFANRLRRECVTCTRRMSFIGNFFENDFLIFINFQRFKVQQYFSDRRHDRKNRRFWIGDGESATRRQGRI